ncbi:MAG TPA: exopolysaccharide biosynthesis protein, partial [Microbacterium sp.]|nr:exopolysaccharide biosynthesis protein [Microbacterium sp.]
VVYRDEPAREGLVFYEDGTVAVYDETTTSADELLADGAWNTLSFGPAIVE